MRSPVTLPLEHTRIVGVSGEFPAGKTPERSSGETPASSSWRSALESALCAASWMGAMMITVRVQLYMSQRSRSSQALRPGAAERAVACYGGSDDAKRSSARAALASVLKDTSKHILMGRPEEGGGVRVPATQPLRPSPAGRVGPGGAGGVRGTLRRN